MSPYRPASPLRIGVLAPPWVAVPPPEYGGTELVVDNLARGLSAAGHDVTLFATGDSSCPVSRRWCFPGALGTTAELSSELAQVQAGYDALADVDVIHDHTFIGPLWASKLERRPPVVTTVHGTFSSEVIALLTRLRHEVSVVAISRHQRCTAPYVRVDAVIRHGIDVPVIPVGQGRGGFVLFLGRMHPDKGVHRAVRVARRAGKRLVIAAKMWEPEERAYFEREVQPLLGDDAVYVGEVGGRAKHELLGEAEALINPIRWPEPFGLVMIEALATGTPVVTFSAGAATEIVEHDRTGFLCADEDDMASRLGQIGDLDRHDCRNAAATRFSTERMVADHVRLYRGLLATDAPAGADTSYPSPARSLRVAPDRRDQGRREPFDRTLTVPGVPVEAT